MLEFCFVAPRGNAWENSKISKSRDSRKRGTLGKLKRTALFSKRWLAWLRSWSDLQCFFSLLLGSAVGHFVLFYLTTIANPFPQPYILTMEALIYVLLVGVVLPVRSRTFTVFNACPFTIWWVKVLCWNRKKAEKMHQGLLWVIITCLHICRSLSLFLDVHGLEGWASSPKLSNRVRWVLHMNRSPTGFWPRNL